MTYLQARQLIAPVEFAIRHNDGDTTPALVSSRGGGNRRTKGLDGKVPRRHELCTATIETGRPEAAYPSRVFIEGHMPTNLVLAVAENVHLDGVVVLAHPQCR